MNEKVIDYLAQCYGIEKPQLKPLSGGHWNLVYEFSKNNKTYVLRIAPIEININVTKGMVEWIDFLGTYGVSVSRPVFSVNNRLVEFTEKKGKSYSIVLFDLVVLFNGSDKYEFSVEFMKNYLRGYITENPVNTYWIKQIPYFLKLLEIGVYHQIYKNYDANNDDPWCRKFMANRKYRIENDIPYISLDFEDLLEIK